MRSGETLRAILGTPAVLLSSGSAHLPPIETGGHDGFTAAVPGPPAAITSNLSCWHRWRSTRPQKSQWLLSGSVVSLAPTPALTPQISQPAELNVPPTRAVSKLSKAEKIELAIDSLHNYDLLKPIPVLIEPLGDTVFVAEAPDLNLSTTGNSIGAAFLLLKEQVITTYEGYRSKKGTDGERARQLAAFEQYIGKARRHWF